jgi:hypothetical protein
LEEGRAREEGELPVEEFVEATSAWATLAWATLEAFLVRLGKLATVAIVDFAAVGVIGFALVFGFVAIMVTGIAIAASERIAGGVEDSFSAAKEVAGVVSMSEAELEKGFTVVAAVSFTVEVSSVSVLSLVCLSVASFVSASTNCSGFACSCFVRRWTGTGGWT